MSKFLAMNKVILNKDNISNLQLNGRWIVVHLLNEKLCISLEYADADESSLEFVRVKNVLNNE
jgi:hypothetical protein